MPMLLCPLASSRPMTWNDRDPSRILLPRGSWLPKSLSRTVWPRMHTAAPARDSLSLNVRPLWSRRFRTARYPPVVPVTEVDQFSFP